MKACESSRAATLPAGLTASATSGTANPRHVDPHLLQRHAGVGLGRVAHPLAHRIRYDGDVDAVGDHHVDVHVGHVLLLAPSYHDALVDLARAEDAPDALGEGRRSHPD